MIDYINSNQAGFWIMIGFGLMAAEVLLFGFSTIIFLFAGLAALITGLLMMFSVLPETWTAGIASFGILTGVVSFVLWKPLRNLQSGSASTKPVAGHSSDLIGLEFVTEQDLAPGKHGNHRYSGVDWKVELAAGAEADIAAGSRVKVVSVDAGVFRVNLA